MHTSDLGLCPIHYRNFHWHPLLEPASCQHSQKRNWEQYISKLLPQKCVDSVTLRSHPFLVPTTSLPRVSPSRLLASRHLDKYWQLRMAFIQLDLGMFGHRRGHQQPWSVHVHLHVRKIFKERPKHLTAFVPERPASLHPPNQHSPRVVKQ